jgi:anti-sigma B factor antagonist
MKPALQIARSARDGIEIVALSGFLDGRTSVDLERCFDGLFAAGNARVVIELSHLSYIASAGVGVFIDGQYRAKNNGGNVQLVNPTANVREILLILGLDSLIGIHETLELALSAAKAG